MAPHHTKTIKRAINYWWLLAINGIALMATGICVFVSPASAYLSLSLLFGGCILVIGVLESIFGLTAQASFDGWGWSLVSGILDIIIGTLLLFYPEITKFILSFILGMWLIFRGISALGFSLDMKSYGAPDWGLLLILAIAICFFGVMVLIVPPFGLANIKVWTAISFIAAGLFRISLALRLRKLKIGLG